MDHVGLRVAMIAEVPRGQRDAQQAAALSRLLSTGDAETAQGWSREGAVGSMAEWTVDGAPVMTIVGLTPARELTCSEGHDLYELGFTFLNAAPSDLATLVATARERIFEVFGALRATRGVADVQARAGWAWATGGAAWIALHGPGSTRPRIWEIFRHRRLPGGGFARVMWRDPLRPPSGTTGPSWRPTALPSTRPRPPPTYRVVGDRLLLEDDRECALMAGVVEEDDVRAALDALGAPAHPHARHAWLYERGLREIEGVEGTPAVLGLVLARRRSYTTCAVFVTRSKAERMLVLARERLAARGIDREPDLVVRLG